MKTNIQYISIFAIAICIMSCTKNTTKTFACGDTFKDIDGNTYHTVSIGNQCWMTENLKTGKYTDGTTIPNVTDSAQWSNATTGGYSYQNNDPANNTIYGKLYNWYAVQTGKLAPAGWHVPSDAEWTTLTSYLVDSVAGSKMKATTAWISSPGITNTNSSGFTAYPGSNRSDLAVYGGIGAYAGFWSSTEYNTGNAWYLALGYYIPGTSRFNGSKKNGFSVRCVKD